MYNVVLLAALAAGSSAPAGWHGHRQHGSAVVYGCAGCSGCHGEGNGGCWGCHGSANGMGAYGASGAGGYGWSSGYVAGFGHFASWYGCHGCYGCYGCYGCTGYLPGPPPPPSAPAGGETIPPPRPEEKKSAAPSPARVIVELPENARFYVDEQAIKASGRRVFSTPALQPGQTYFYDLRVEVEIDGKTQSQSRRVVVRAGQEIRASFLELDSVRTVRADAGAGR